MKPCPILILAWSTISLANTPYTHEECEADYKMLQEASEIEPRNTADLKFLRKAEKQVRSDYGRQVDDDCISTELLNIGARVRISDDPDLGQANIETYYFSRHQTTNKPVLTAIYDDPHWVDQNVIWVCESKR